MDDISQTVEAPVAEQPVPQEAPAERMSVDDYRSQLASGEIRKKVKESGLSPDEFIGKYVDAGETPSAPTPEAAEQRNVTPEQPPQEAPQEQPEPQAETPPPSAIKKPSKKWEAPDFMDAAKSFGVEKYSNPYELIKGLSQNETALAKYKNDAKTFRKGFEDQSLKVTELEKTLKELQAKVESKPAARPAPTPKIEVPDAPAVPTLEGLDTEQDNANVQSLVRQYQEREAALQKQAQTQINALKNEFEQKTSNLEQQFNSLKSDREREKLEREADKKKNAQVQARNNAFVAAKELGKKVDKYKLSKPIEAVDEEYGELIDDVNHLHAVNPRLQGRNLIQEFLNGNQETIDLFNNRSISISEDMKTYMLLADLEQDCAKHNLYVMQDGESTGVPDLVKALRLREEDAGVRQQEIVDARMEGFDQANRLQDAPSSGAQQLAPGQTSTPPPTETLTAESALEKLQALKNIKNQGQRAKAYEQLKPLLIQQGLIPNEGK